MIKWAADWLRDVGWGRPLREASGMQGCWRGWRSCGQECASGFEEGVGEGDGVVALLEFGGLDDSLEEGDVVLDAFDAGGV